MKFLCRVAQQPGGTWIASCQDDNVGRVEASASSREQVLEKMRGELRYRLELCPCSGESYQHIDVVVVADG